jgi:hypothetical protein
MAFKPCTHCAQRFTGKPTSIYSAWMEDDIRQSWVAKLCGDCTFNMVGPPVRRAIARNGDESCDLCGATGPGRYDPLYLTVYQPRAEMEQFELVTCDECTEQLRDLMLRMSQPVPNRSQGRSQGPVNNRDAARPVPW